MALHIDHSAYYFKVGNRVIDKVTDSYNPPRHWFRIKIEARGKTHANVQGQITNLWWSNFRSIKDFDPLNFLWINEPVQMGDVLQVRKYYKPHIAHGNYELCGLMHSKLPMKPVDPNVPLPKENIPDEQLPEVELNQSLNEPGHVKKRRHFPYGIYYVEVMVCDEEGHTVKKSFKVWAFRDTLKCKIRTTRFYERFMLKLKSILPPQ